MLGRLACRAKPGPTILPQAQPGLRGSRQERSRRGVCSSQVVCATLLYGQGPAEPGSLSVANSPSWAPPPVDLHLLPAATGQAARAVAEVATQWVQSAVAPFDVFGQWQLDVLFFAAVGVLAYSVTVAIPRQ